MDRKHLLGRSFNLDSQQQKDASGRGERVTLSFKYGRAIPWEE